MPLTVEASDTIDTTEAAVLALVKQRHDEEEQADCEPSQADFQRGKLAALKALAEDLSNGEHWNVPGIAV